jgi:hypothetical protein
MVETTLSSAIAPSAKPPQKYMPEQRREAVNPDGSAIPDIIAYHHRPEDLGDLSNQDVSEDSGQGDALFGQDGLTFGDILDIINPLQHIPVVSTIYRAITGDEISPGARVAGGALYGGPIGFAVATANALVEAATGEDIGDTILTAFTGDTLENPDAGTTESASAGPALAAAEAGPATIGAGTMPVSLLPPRTAQPREAPQIFAAITAPPPPAKLPFGGIGTLPSLLHRKNDAEDPVSALLQVRTAVPLGGPIKGLGNTTRARMPHQTAMPAVGPRLADKLSALAAQTVPAKAAGAKPDEKTGSPSAPVSAVLVPQRMIDTLDRYERMKKAETPAG